MTPKVTKLHNLEIIDSTFPDTSAEAKDKKFWYDQYYFPEVLIKITGTTRLGDIKKAWPQIQKAQSRLPRFKARSREVLYQERDERIVELWKAGKQPEEIRHIIDNEGLGSLDTSYIRKIIATHPKRKGHIRGDKLKLKRV